MNQGLTLTLVRHGSTTWNEDGRWQGLTDLPLGPAGEAQALALRAKLRGETFTAIYSSPLHRAHRTAELALPGQTIKLDTRLREYHFGALEGFTIPEMQAHPEFKRWQRDPWRQAAPGGDSLQTLAQRLRGWAEALPNGNVIAFSHSIAIRTLLVDLLGLPLVTQANYPIPYRERIKNGEYVQVKRQNGSWTRIQ